MTKFVGGPWIYIAATYDGSSNASGAKIYINGVPETLTVDYNALSASIQNTQNWLLGDYVSGTMDEVKISNVARTADEIAESYRAGRDHRMTRLINPVDLSGKTSVPFYVASDRQGTFMEATAGENAYVNDEPDANTVGLWHLEEQTGLNAYLKDASGYGNNGTPSGTTQIQGKIGKARSFNGSSDYISISDSDNWYFDGDFTLDTWVYLNSNSVTQTIAAQYYQTGQRSWFWYINPSNIQFGWSANCSTETSVNVSWTPSTGVWYHLAVERSGTNITFFVNGMQQGATQTSSGAYCNAAQPLSLGALQGTGPVWQNFLNGIIDEFRVTKGIARSADDIRAAYEVGKRTHPITIDFKSKLDPSDLITGSSDLAFNIDSTAYGASSKGANLYPGDKIIVKENYGGKDYIAQGTVGSVNTSTGSVSLLGWDQGSTFPSGGQAGFSTNATVFKWQREYMSLNGSLPSQRNNINRLTFRITDGSQGANIWLDDVKSAGSYLTTPGGSTVTSGNNRYFQYRAILSSSDTNVSPSLYSVTLNYAGNQAPNTPTLISPTNGAQNQVSNPVLKVSDTDPESNNLQYYIELCTDLSMTQNCQDFDQTTSQAGWSGQNADSGTAYTSGSTATFSIQNALTANTTYYWQAWAIDYTGSDSWSGTQGTPNSFTTTQVTSVYGCIVDDSGKPNQAIVQWKNAVSNMDHLRVDRAVDGGAFSQLSDTVPANSTSYTDSTTSTNHYYQYRVRTEDISNNGGNWCTTPIADYRPGISTLENINMEGINLN